MLTERTQSIEVTLVKFDKQTQAYVLQTRVDYRYRPQTLICCGYPRMQRMDWWWKREKKRGGRMCPLLWAKAPLYHCVIIITV